MKKIANVMLCAAAFLCAGMSYIAQTSPAKTSKPAFDVISIKPNVPAPNGIRGGGGGVRGNRYSVTGTNLRALLQSAYRPASDGPGQLQVIGAPAWIDSDRYDIQATLDCSGGVLSRDQVPLLIESMLEDRFQLKAHMEARELPIYNLVVGKDGPKLKASENQAPLQFLAGPPPEPCGAVPAGPATPPIPPPPPPPPPRPGEAGIMDPKFVMPRGSMMVQGTPTGTTLVAAAVPLTNIIGLLQGQLGRPVVDKTELKGLFDFKMQYSAEGAATVGIPPGALGPPPSSSGSAPAAAEPLPSLFTAIQTLGLKLESAKGQVNVLVIESVQKPTLN